MTSVDIPWKTVNQILACDTIVSHAHCSDGSLSAYTLSLLFQQLESNRLREIIFASYSEVDKLPVRPGIVFVDFFPQGRGEEYNRSKAFVLDHHTTVKQEVKSFGDRGVYADAVENPGVSGASLAFDVADMSKLLPEGYSLPLLELTHLIQIRDTWQKDNPRFQEASEISDALRFIPSYDLFDKSTWAPRYSPEDLLDFLRSLAPVIRANNRAKVERLVKDAYFFKLLSGLRVAVIPSVSQTSDVLTLLEGDVDVLVGFYLTPKGLGLSLRSNGNYNVAALAQACGGGGHVAAAGCSLPLAMDRCPYLQIRELLASYEIRGKGLK